jgi:hypothetical protein
MPSDPDHKKNAIPSTPAELNQVARQLAVREWRAWADQHGLDADRPTQDNLDAFADEMVKRSHSKGTLALLGEGGYRTQLLRALAREGYKSA